jgi:hypothetical protein
MTDPLDRLLAHARIDRRPHTGIREAEERLAARIAARMWQGALRIDDALQPSVAAVTRPASRQALPQRVCRDRLRALCEVTVADDLHRLRTFLVSRIPEPDGAMVLGCVLYLANREYSARFWWQFAAGADNLSAPICLYLHHMGLGETEEADFWRQQANLDSNVPHLPDHATLDDTHVYLRHVMLSRGYLEASQPSQPSPAVVAVIDYVPDAIGYVDGVDVDLPLPAPDFAERIEELITT